MEERVSAVKPASRTRSAPRARYSPPRLIEWGTIRDLTKGPEGGDQDSPVMGTENF